MTNYQEAAVNSRKRRNRPLFDYSIPLSEDEWNHLLEWVEQNYSGHTKQSVKGGRT